MLEPNADKKQLEQAFETFSRMSAELDASYQALQDRIGRLTDELVEARSQRIKELARKHDVPIIEDPPLARAQRRRSLLKSRSWRAA